MYFCPYRAAVDAPMYPGRCPGLWSYCPFRACRTKLSYKFTFSVSANLLPGMGQRCIIS